MSAPLNLLDDENSSSPELENGTNVAIPDDVLGNEYYRLFSFHI